MVYLRWQPATSLQNFIHLRQSAAEILLFVQKSKMAAAAILNYNFVMLDHPRSPFVHLKFPSKFCVWGSFDPQTLFFYHRDPQKALPYVETRVLSYKWSWSVFWCDLEVTARIQKKRKNPKITENSLLAQSPFLTSPVNQILHAGLYHGYLSWFKVLLRSVEKCGSCGGRNFGLLINLAHHLYNILLLLHKPWSWNSRIGILLILGFGIGDCRDPRIVITRTKVN